MRPVQPVLAGLFVFLLCAPQAPRAQSLVDFYQRALENNPAVRIRELSIDQAQAQQEQARSRLLPQISATGSYTWNDYKDALTGPLHYSGTRGTLQARQALLDVVSYFQLQSAKSAVLQAEEQREAARTALAADVVDRYLQVLQASDEIDYLQAEKETTRKQLDRLRFMHERQLAKVTDLYEVEAYHQGLLTREIEASNAKAIALERLREATGLSATQVAPLMRTSFPTIGRTEEQWLDDAAKNNRNLIALQHAIEAARKLVGSSRAQHLPLLALTAGRTYSDQGFDNRAVPSYWVTSVGVQLTIPLYEGGRVQGATREAAARYEIAREQHEQSRREIERETRTAYLNALASLARIDSVSEEVRALENVVAAQRKSHELGVSTIVDLLIAQRRLFRSRSDQSKARYDYVRDVTLLRMHAGSLGAADIEEIDSWMAKEPPRGAALAPMRQPQAVVSAMPGNTRKAASSALKLSLTLSRPKLGRIAASGEGNAWGVESEVRISD